MILPATNNGLAPTSGIAHVLFLDIVGYSNRTTSAQARVITRLNEIVAALDVYTEAQSRKAVLTLPTGDGMALLYFDDVTAPARTAIALSHILKSEPNRDEIKLRMGIHSGLIQRQLDINGKENVVGEGINTAQRVLDFAGDDHILLSSQYAMWLGQLDEWRDIIHPLGDGLAKHGLRLTVYNLYQPGDFGNPDTPQKLSLSAERDDLPVSGDKSMPSPAKPVPIVDSASVENRTRIVMLYKRSLGDESDERLMEFLEERFRTDGCAVFVDRGRKMSSSWAQNVEKEVREADAVVAIVSPRSLQSEMLEFELETAQEQWEKSGKPILLPVSIGTWNPDSVEGPVAAIISPLNRFVWNGPEDDQRLIVELLSAIREPLKPAGNELKLEPVGGAVPPDSPFYIERSCDEILRKAIAGTESILLIKGARQIGKTSLLSRAAKQARDAQWRVAVTDFQKLSTSQINDEDRFYRLLAATLARQLKFTYDFATEWDDIFGANLNMENFLRELLIAADTPLVWCMDEADKLFSLPYASDFFGLVRSWHNSRSTEPNGPWTKLTVVIAYATEAHLFIQDLNQSPFNVGRRIELEDFNIQQIVAMNGKYGSPLQAYAQAEQLQALIGGQPYLSRRALDTLATGTMSFSSLIEQADDDNGPFSDHLKRLLVSVSQIDSVATFVRKVLSGDATPATDRNAYYRLLAAGIITQDRDGRIAFRCDLYRRYLLQHLAM